MKKDFSELMTTIMMRAEKIRTILEMLSGNDEVELELIIDVEGKFDVFGKIVNVSLKPNNKGQIFYKIYLYEGKDNSYIVGESKWHFVPTMSIAYNSISRTVREVEVEI